MKYQLLYNNKKCDTIIDIKYLRGVDKLIFWDWTYIFVIIGALICAAASPSYQLPSKLLGLEIIEPGFKKILLKPRLYGLHWAEISLPTPFCELYCKMIQGESPILKIPKGITYCCQ